MNDNRIVLVVARADEIRDGEMEIRWGISNGPFGNMFLARSSRGITHLSFFDDDEAESLAALRKDWPKAKLIRDDSGVGGLISGNKHRLHLVGTPFQIKVWQALLDIPCGEFSTYGGLAEKIEMPGASRAVGSAVGANRVSLLIPCHRVIRADGSLGGYRWGTERKRAMLAEENSAAGKINYGYLK
jgi:AraC family transcriptional regulator of adaptative response/methylated-DNA-[protein]-cysteine methyltransferase